jgi:haloalkane dehalogenase
MRSSRPSITSSASAARASTYATTGSGETVLLLHGNPSWSFLYRKIIGGLAGEFRCVAPDFPGYGMSCAAPG